MIERESTRDLLARSLLDLAKTRPIGKVTVAEIAGNCGIAKRTFYNHFEGKDDLVTYLVRAMVSEPFGRWEAGLISYAEMQQAIFRDTVRFCPTSETMIGSDYGLGSAFEAVASATTGVYEDYLKKVLDVERLDEGIVFELRFSCRACMLALYDWYHSESRESIEEFADRCVRCLPEGLKPYFLDNR